MSPSSSASSLVVAGSTLVGGSHAGLVLAAMALSGTLALFSLCRANKPHLVDPSPAARQLRPCLSSSEKRKKWDKARRGSMVKRVRFADDVVDNGGGVIAVHTDTEEEGESCGRTRTTMPANREALYRGMLRGRSMLRVACSY